MAMLAERKRKQKWTLNPRGKLWSDDSNKYGQRMLEKMGWTSGKGLGSKENGITEHIKQSFKNDSKGIGYEDRDDQWTKHGEDFSALLQSLNGHTETPELEQPKESLEKKSESSRARVHYHKFTRGKDLSTKSEKDIANIFGKKSLKSEKRKKTEEVSESKEEANFYGIVTVNGGNMAEYFKSKLKLNTPRKTEKPSESNGEHHSQISVNSINDLQHVPDREACLKEKQLDELEASTTAGFGYVPPTLSEAEPVSTTSEQDQQAHENKDKKKRKKNKTKVVINECFDNPGFEDLPDLEPDTQQISEVNRTHEEDSMAFTNYGLNAEDSPPRKRKLETIYEIDEETKQGPARKKKIRHKVSEHLEKLDEETRQGPPKKRKSKDKTTSANLDDIITSSQSDEKKKKKKKGKTDVVIEAAADSTVDLQIDGGSEELKKKKKRAEATEISQEVEADTSTEIPEEMQPSKSEKKKKKKAKKSEGHGVDNPACTATSHKQQVEETIASLTEAIDDYQHQLENQMNENKAARSEKSSKSTKATSSRSHKSHKSSKHSSLLDKKDKKKRSAKSSVKEHIKGSVKYNFEGSNLHEIAGYGNIR